MPTDYAVAFVGDDALHGVDWAFIQVESTLVFAIKEHAVTAAALAEAWGAFRALEVRTAA